MKNRLLVVLLLWVVHAGSCLGQTVKVLVTNTLSRLIVVMGESNVAGSWNRYPNNGVFVYPGQAFEWWGTGTYLGLELGDSGCTWSSRVIVFTSNPSTAGYYVLTPNGQCPPSANTSVGWSVQSPAQPAVFTNRVVAAGYTNDGLRAVTVTLRLLAGGANGTIVSTLTNQFVLPGQAVGYSATSTNYSGNPDTWAYYDGTNVVRVGGLTSYLTTNAPAAASAEFTRGWSAVFTNAAPLPSVLVPSVAVPEARATNYSSSAAQAATWDANADARNRELGQLFVGAANANFQGQQAVVRALADNAAFLGQVGQGQAAQSAAGNALLASIDGKISQVPTGSTGVVGTIAGFSLGTNGLPSVERAAFEDFLPGVEGVGRDEVGFVIPLSAFGSGLQDVNVNVFDSEWGVRGGIDAVRAFVLVLVTVAVAFLFFRLLSHLHG